MKTHLPPHCPNPSCAFHCSPTGWRFKRIGFFHPEHSRRRPIQRYLCLHCRRSFSSQTFMTTYWMRRPDLQPAIFYRILACSGFRQIAREFGVAPTTILNHVIRLGRHCLLFQQVHRPIPKEPVALDGFESFEYSQYFPCHFNNLVGKASHFFYLFTESPLRRKGRMTAHQLRQRTRLEARLGRPDPKAIQKGVAELLRLATKPGQSLELHTDDHPAYLRAIRSLPDLKVRHLITPSVERRTPKNPLFPVNLLDLLIRHGSANHKRETIAFSKRRQGAIERLAILQIWRNFIKPFSERRGGGTPAQRLGLLDRALSVGDILRRRLFKSVVGLPETLARYYRREVMTAALPANRTNRLSYAC